jgi:hypothetical protein
MFGLLYLFKCLPRTLRFVAEVLGICFALAVFIYPLSVFSHLLAHVHAHRTV